jgi:hypothetical protein
VSLITSGKEYYLCKMLAMKYILSIAIGVIILLHSVIPHEHNEISNESAEIQSHECSTTFFDGVKFTFGLDHGDGHLEQFVKVVTDSPKLTLSGINEVVFVEIDKKIETATTILYANCEAPPDQLRGPPILSV